MKWLLAVVVALFGIAAFANFVETYQVVVLPDLNAYLHLIGYGFSVDWTVDLIKYWIPATVGIWKIVTSKAQLLSLYNQISVSLLAMIAVLLLSLIYCQDRYIEKISKSS